MKSRRLLQSTSSPSVDMESPVDIFSCTRLLSSGLRVSTPPTGRPVPRKLQLVPDENDPPSPCSSRFSRSRTPLEDQDSNSQDSGCAMSCSSDDSQGFRFVEPSGFAPKRLSSMESPRRCLQFSSFSCPSSSSFDEGFLETHVELPETDEKVPSPPCLSSLLSGRILNENSPRKHEAVNVTPQRRVRSLSCRDELKRPMSDCTLFESSPIKMRLKRLKSSNQGDNAENKGTLFEYGFWKSAAPKPLTQDLKVMSETELNLKLALQRSTQEELIGNFSRPFALPLMPGKHQDLKSISSETLVDLINGKFESTVSSFKIIDCRYPYEYDGGHIKGAVNLYTCEHILKDLLTSKPKPKEPNETDKRDILVFHCEFSSERGPFLSRFLRKQDRAENDYPNLHYPETYLLHGGYSEFFKSHKEMCEPMSYMTMQDPKHSSDLKHFKAKSKSWAPSNHRKLTMRSLARLGF